MKLKINELKSIEVNATILRACNVLSIDLANRVNGFGTSAKIQIKKFEDALEVLNDRSEQIKLMVDNDAKAKAEDQLVSDIEVLNKKTYEIDIKPINVSEFAGLEINGEKEIPQADGRIAKFNYRDAYYDLMSLGCILQ